MTPEQLKKNMEKFVGKEVLVLKPHPWAGERGKTVSVDMVQGKPAMKVELENGTSCYVFKGPELMFLTGII